MFNIQISFEVTDVVAQRKRAALEGLPLFLGENPASLLTACLVNNLLIIPHNEICGMRYYHINRDITNRDIE